MTSPATGGDPQTRKQWNTELIRWGIATLLIPFAGWVWSQVQAAAADKQEKLERARTESQLQIQAAAAAKQKEIENARTESEMMIKLVPLLADPDPNARPRVIANAILMAFAEDKELSPRIAPAVRLAILDTEQRAQAGKASAVELQGLDKIRSTTDVPGAGSAGTEPPAAPQESIAVRSDITLSLPRVYIQIFDETDRPAAGKVQDWIAKEKHWLAPGIENVGKKEKQPIAPPAARVYYFNAGDAEPANALAKWMKEKVAPEAEAKLISTRAPIGQLEVWFPRSPPQSAYCYQEEVPTRQDALRYSVYCHPTEELCKRWRGNNPKTRQSPCVLLEIAKTGWVPQFEPKTAIWYGHRAAPFPAPFPPLPTNE